MFRFFKKRSKKAEEADALHRENIAVIRQAVEKIQRASETESITKVIHEATGGKHRGNRK